MFILIYFFKINFNKLDEFDLKLKHFLKALVKNDSKTFKLALTFLCINRFLQFAITTFLNYVFKSASFDIHKKKIACIVIVRNNRHKNRFLSTQY